METSWGLSIVFFLGEVRDEHLYFFDFPLFFSSSFSSLFFLKSRELTRSAERLNPSRWRKQSLASAKVRACNGRDSSALSGNWGVALETVL